MTMRRLTIAAAFLGAVAWAMPPASAQTIDLSGVTGGDTFASSDDSTGTGTTGSGSTTGGSLLGGSGDTTANLLLGSGGAGSASGSGTLGSGTTSGSPSGSVVIGTGANPANGGSTNTVVLNPDGTFTISTGGPGTTGTPGTTTVTADQLRAALETLDDQDAAELKRKCENVLAKPGSFAPGTVGLCKVLATV